MSEWLIKRGESSTVRLSLDIPKGTRIEPAALEEIIGAKRDTSHYAFGLMALQARFNTDSETGDRKKIARISNGGIEICTDDEGVEYAQKTYLEGVKKIQKSTVLDGMVDNSNLSVERQAEHQRQKQIRLAALHGLKLEERKAKNSLKKGN